ncbi:MAG: hypothetical protein ACRC5T_02710 [Cetobacterium sp.]
MADCLIKKVATVNVYENKNEVRTFGFMAGDKNTPVVEVKFKHLFGESNLSNCKLRWVLVDDVGSLVVGEVSITQDNEAFIQLPNSLFVGERKMKVQLTVASADGDKLLNLQQFTDLKVVNGLVGEIAEPVYQILLNSLQDEIAKYKEKVFESMQQLNTQYADSKASLEDYLLNAENGGNAEFLQGYSPTNFSRVEETIATLKASTKWKVGDVVQVLGYYEKGDGAHHLRKISTVDDGIGELLANSLFANVVRDSDLNVGSYGIKANDISFIDTNARILEKLIKLNRRIVFEIGNYYIRNLKINQSVITIFGKSIDLYHDRPHTNIYTDGADFITENLNTSPIYRINGVRFCSKNYSGLCFSSSNGNGVGGNFQNVFFDGFEKAFYSSSYLDSFRGKNISFRKCIYGFHSELASNNSTIDTLDILGCVFGVNMSGLQSSIVNVHAGGVVPKEILDRFDYGFLIKSNNVSGMYVEGYAYSSDTSHLYKMYILAIPNINAEVGYSFSYNDIAFPKSGDFSNARHILFTGSWFGNNSSRAFTTITIKNCNNNPTKIYTLPTCNIIPNIISENYIDGTNPLMFGIEVVIPIGTVYSNGFIKIEPKHFAQKIINLLTTNVEYSIYDESSKKLRALERGIYELSVDFFSPTLSKDFTFSHTTRNRQNIEKNITKTLKLTANQTTTVTSNFFHNGFLAIALFTNLTKEELATLEIIVKLKHVGFSRISNVSYSNIEMLDNLNYIEEMKEVGIYEEFKNTLQEIKIYKESLRTEKNILILDPIIPIEILSFAKEKGFE